MRWLYSAPRSSSNSRSGTTRRRSRGASRERRKPRACCRASIVSARLRVLAEHRDAHPGVAQVG